LAEKSKASEGELRSEVAGSSPATPAIFQPFTIKNINKTPSFRLKEVCIDRKYNSMPLARLL